MTDTLLIIALVFCVIITALLIAVLCKKPKSVQTDNRDLAELIHRELENFKAISDAFNKNVVQAINNLSVSERERLTDLTASINELIKRTEYRMTELKQQLNDSVKDLRETVEKQLTEMRFIVDEKLQSTLEKRLDGSYKIIADNLDVVSKGIGEVKRLAESVGDVKKVFTNVKLRGTWGETQLGNLLEQILSPEQFNKNFRINPTVDAFVDYVVVLPGRDGDITYLPIDSKFPIEEYQRMLSHEESGDLTAKEKSVKSLMSAIKKQAEDIATKYILPPKTTDFAIMYFPLEGLYAETLKNDEMMAHLQRLRIMVCGPTNLGALLNSLQTGFKTLAIEKRSSELWQLLSAFKTEFIRFSALLEKTSKKLQEAQDTIDSAQKKTKTIERKLKTVAEISDSDTDGILTD